MAGIDFAAVRSAVACRQLADFEGLKIDKSGRARCPWCASAASRFNMKFNRDGSSHCFACGKTADCIELASKLWSVSRADAARQLNDLFKLGLAPEQADAAKLEQRRQQREDERAEQWATWRAENALMGEAADELREAERALWAYTGTDWTPDLVAILRRYDRAAARWNFLWATQKPIPRPPEPRPDRQQLEAALKAAQDEQAAAWAAVRATDATAAGYCDLLRQAKNADLWVDFKTLELSLGGRA